MRYSAALEDIHMHVEARLTEIIGPAAGRLHTARSRNDMDMTMYRMRQREFVLGLLTATFTLRRALLDVAEVGGSKFTLEVSSPGLDRKLTKPSHFQRFLGETVRVKLRFPLAGRRNFRGTLSAADDEKIEIEVA